MPSRVTFHCINSRVANWLPDDIGYGVDRRQSGFFFVIEKNRRCVLKENTVVALLQTTPFKTGVGGLRLEDTFLVARE